MQPKLQPISTWPVSGAQLVTAPGPPPFQRGFPSGNAGSGFHRGFPGRLGRECLWLPSSGQLALHSGWQGEAFQGSSNEDFSRHRHSTY